MPSQRSPASCDTRQVDTLVRGWDTHDGRLSRSPQRRAPFCPHVASKSANIVMFVCGLNASRRHGGGAKGPRRSLAGMRKTTSSGMTSCVRRRRESSVGGRWRHVPQDVLRSARHSYRNAVVGRRGAARPTSRHPRLADTFPSAERDARCIRAQPDVERLERRIQRARDLGDRWRRNSSPRMAWCSYMLPMSSAPGKPSAR